MIDLKLFKTNKFQESKLNICDAINTVLGQLGQSALYKKLHPIGCFYRLITKQSIALTSYTKTIEANADKVRLFVREYVQKRRTQQASSKVEGNSDMLSLFLDNPEIFTDDFKPCF